MKRWRAGVALMIVFGGINAAMGAYRQFVGPVPGAFRLSLIALIIGLIGFALFFSDLDGWRKS